jgi:hypothetical protein
MLTSSDRKILLLDAIGGYSIIVYALIFSNTITQSMFAGIIYFLFNANIQVTPQYSAYLKRTGKLERLEQIRRLYAFNDRMFLLAALCIGGIALGVFLYAIQLIVLLPIR